MNIRPAVPDRDNEALCALARRCPQGRHFPFYHAHRDFRERYHLHEDVEVLVCEDKGDLLGSGAVARKRVWLNAAWRPAGYLFDLMADPAHRRRGVGKALVQALQQTCPHADLFYGCLVADNEASCRLFESQGFTAYPRRLLYHTGLAALAAPAASSRVSPI